jgi:hypothetical protein
MSKFELSLTPDYVPSWTLADAVRELFQNGIDQETVDPTNTLTHSYDAATGTLIVCSKNSVLDAKSLLLGATTKANDNATIGKYGEGYKIAALVLLRLGKTFTIYNYGKRETWTAKLVNSRRYGTTILTFFVDKQWIGSAPDNNLTIEVGGISEDEYATVVDNTLLLHEDLGEVLNANRGRILLDKRYAGKLFVNGLFICDVVDLQHGYDVNPQYIKLDRDRKLVSDFEIEWEASRLWDEVRDERLVDLVQSGAKDVRLIKSAGNHWNREKYNIALQRFRDEYGENAVPATNQGEINIINDTYGDAVKPIVVNENMKYFITSSPNYNVPAPDKKIKTALSERFAEWYEAFVETCTEGSAVFEELINELKEMEDNG